MRLHDQAFAARQRARFMLPDGLKFVRPDAARFLKPGTDPADVYPALASRRDAACRADARAFDNAVTQECVVLDQLRGNLVQIKSELAWRRLVHAIALKYSASQPRVPAGSGRESGRWTSDGDGSGSGVGDSDATSGSPLDAFAQATDTGEMLDTIVVDGSDVNPAFDDGAGNFDSDNFLASNDRSNDTTSESNQATPINDTRVVSDADPEIIRPGEQYAQNIRSVTDVNGNPYYARGGHHELPQSLYEKLDLPPETRRVFDSATTGTVPGQTTFRSSPDGTPLSHAWNKAHRAYNRAVAELRDDFLDRNSINPRAMTPSQAEQLIREIRVSENPIIRDYNRAMRMLHRVFRFRFGRGE